MLFLSRLLRTYVPATIVQHETQQEHASPPTLHARRPATEKGWINVLSFLILQELKGFIILKQIRFIYYLLKGNLPRMCTSASTIRQYTIDTTCHIPTELEKLKSLSRYLPLKCIRYVCMYMKIPLSITNTAKWYNELLKVRVCLSPLWCFTMYI